ncbi:hypothetical protein C0992_008833 [Termitomyces sp. T32_za158]|nr:hypothetical protein C0992_008833 [Termitomyces sp. T32_za158]
MKEYASCYVSYDIAETWTGITEFNTQIPGDQEGAAPRAATYEEIARWLLQNGKLYRNEERCLFQQGIPTSLWTKIACRLEIAKPDHHPLEPYDVEDVLEAGKWVLKGTDTSITVCVAPASRPVGNGTPGILPLPTTSIATLLTLNAPSNYVKQEDLDKAILTALSSAMTRLESLMNNSIIANRQRNNQGGNNQPNNNLCHFCGELGHVDEWHCRNPNNIATATLTGNANPDAEQALQEHLIQEILPTSQPTIQPTTVHATLTRQEMINNLEQRLQVLKNQTFDGVEICQPKQAPKGYKPMASAAAPATAPPLAAMSTAPSAPVTVPNPAASTAPTDQSAPAQPPSSSLLWHS